MTRRSLISAVLLTALIALSLWLLFLEDGNNAAGNNNLLEIVGGLEVLHGQIPPETELASRPTLVVFWNTWCPSCVHELVHFRDEYSNIKDAVNLLAVNLVKGERNEAELRQFLSEADLPYPVLADREGKATEAFTFRYIPASFLLDTGGNILHSRQGRLDVDTLMQWLED